MKKKPKIVIVMPAYNAERTISDTYREIPKEYKKHIILVSDASSDKTVAIAKKLGIKVFSHPNNLGYGGNQKTCYWEALKLKPDVVVMLHPDYQYDATMMPYLVQPILDRKFDFMFGSRIATKKGALEGGMPPIKYYVNRIVCFIQNILLGVNFTEHFSGYRAYSAQFLKKIPFQRFSNDFVFDQEMTISSISHGMRIGEIPIPTRYHDKASSIRFLRGAKFILEGFIVIFKLYLHNLRIIKDARFGLSKKKDISLTTGIIMVGFISLLNILIYGIFRSNLSFAAFILLQSTLLYVSLERNIKWTRSLVVLLLFIGLIIALRNGFNDAIFQLSRLEADTLAKRHEFFAEGLGKIYRNRIGLSYFNEIRPILTKFAVNIFAHLDFGKIFNLGNYLSIIFFFPFLIGALKLISEFNRTILIYFAAIFLVGGFLIPGLNYGFYLLLPLINLSIYLGFRTLYRAVRK